ncbi:MAG: MGMT family protein [Sphingobacteriales bacterium]|jgi:methylated-DNA-protein-cysteine methyltransferase related protein|nr:MAG: MGMT family protein [Sphingobacteriales bacterium]
MQSSTFYQDVYDVVKLIPAGRVTSYGAIAAYLGTKGSSRLVGYAMNNSIKTEASIPAHRVVNRNGLLTGKFHFGPGNEMKNLLEQDGLEVMDNQVKNFKSVFWNPTIELEI